MSTKEEHTVYFQEQQQFRQVWLWLLLIVVSALSSGTVLWIATGGVVLGEDAMSTNGLTSLAVISVTMNALILALFFTMRLTVEVSTSGLFVQFKPLHRKVHKIDLKDVTLVESITYSALLEYGGYGIRKRRKATAYNVSGDQGVRIYYENGYHYLIGSSRPDALAQAINDYIAQKS